VNSLLEDAEMREMLFERAAATRRLTERTAVELAEADRAAAAARHAAERAPREQESEQSGLERMFASSGAIIVVGLGLAFVFVITLVSLGTVPDEQKAAIVTAAFTVLGTIVGAYFGVRVGAHGKQEAEAARVASEAKVVRLAAHVDKQDAARVLGALG
jgi:hypothetical protein